eukprot:CAMPEP_0202820382 /NCGR_PEP_ID=MMETSP1389-20130828/9699_1 /ASSEMBLY_ACC=CAM_ASM_000865 /TAXON_ID=302021 /ORGANISM="Rhodomonas sp., Strain CCMP768" /LENGTH=89 /DNA_ID=CAMNT_0049493051 /DNA_START=20 /DNA_END=286 /DNA_ORIENTATION=-
MDPRERPQCGSELQRREVWADLQQPPGQHVHELVASHHHVQTPERPQSGRNLPGLQLPLDFQHPQAKMMQNIPALRPHRFVPPRVLDSD